MTTMDAKRHPWVRGNLSVPRAVLDELEREAEAAYGRDEEACGYLVGARDTPLATCANNLNTPAYDTLLELGADASTGEAIRKAKIAEDEAFVAQFR